MVLIFRLFIALVVTGVLIAIATIGKMRFGIRYLKMFLVLKYHTRLNDDELYRDIDLNKTILVSVNPEEHQRNLEAAEQWKMSHDPNQATFDAPLLGK